MSLSPSLLDSPFRQAERALRKPSSAVWLRSVSIQTARFDDALSFYVTTLGLTLGSLGAHPLTAQTRAKLLDAEGNEVFELVEADGPACKSAHELAFAMPRRTVMLLRARLGVHGVPYTEAAGALFLRDVDDTLLRIEAL